ncbi:tetratricopeptide repeat protein [Sorangium sp. So ce1078]|uniref:tetratricopeptide repeat protein n=1 Tax=Sorangium sp. So ce1078 TaxID=3133329 RepID=UPI003F622738
MATFPDRVGFSRLSVQVTTFSAPLTRHGWRKYRSYMRFVAQSLWICLMVGVVTGTTYPVRAEDRNPSTVRSDGSSVKDHLRRARRARASGKWTEAHAAYKAAFEAIDSTSVTERESAEIAGELGLCELKLRKFRDAAEHLAWSLERRKALSPEQQKGFADGEIPSFPEGRRVELGALEEDQ